MSTARSRLGAVLLLVLRPWRLLAKVRQRLIQSAAQRFERWWQSRLPLTDQQTLHQRNVYIVPTAPGWMLAATLLVLLVASINFQLNLGYITTFLLAGSALAGMHVCHSNLRGLRLSLPPPESGFARRSLPVRVELSNPDHHVRHGVGVGPAGSGVGALAYVDLAAQSTTPVELALSWPTRGRHPLPALTAETRFPLGTFRVWTIWRPAATVLVYPGPETPCPPLPPGEPSGTTGLRAAVSQGAEFDGVRPWRRGDPLKSVVWKKAAKVMAAGNGELVSREQTQAQHSELWLDWRSCGATGLEAQLSRLCAWVVQADRLGLRYGLRLPAVTLQPDEGEGHRRRCLEALALC
jgi:uncharacterized protein (DUF58 family)